ncbi:MAG: hypothetical protein AAB403_06575, partial [Planctomycetota bacterium]
QFKSELELPDREQSKAATAQKAIREQVAKHLYVANSFLAGSYARYTKITPLSDIDVIFVRNSERVGLASSGGTSPNEALVQLAEAVKKAYPSTARIEKQSRSVNVRIQGLQFGFDLIPAWLRTPDGYWIPDADDSRWIPTDPDQHAAMMTEANRRCENKLKPVIKMAKHWSRYNYDRLRSFHIELVCAAIFITGEIQRWQLGVARFLANAFNYVGRVMMDPIYGVSRVDKVLTEKEETELLSRIRYDSNNAVEALELEQAGKDASAIEKWRHIFGTGFPC